MDPHAVDIERSDLIVETEERPHCSRPVANCVFLIIAFCLLLFFTLFVRPERPPPIPSILPQNDVIHYLRQAADVDARFQEDFHLRLRHYALALGSSRRDRTMASDLTKMLMEHDETHKELMQKNGVKSRLSSAKGRYAREVILHRLTNVADLWLAYQELLKTIACERTRALNYFIVEMISNPLEAKGEQLEAIVEKYDREVDGIEKTVAEMDKRAVRLWTNFRKHNTSGVSQCCIKDASDYGFLYKKYTDLYVEAMYSADTCLPLNICSEKTSQEFARWPFMITIFLIVFLVSLFNSKARSEDPRDADDELNPDDPRASGNLNSVTIPGFVFRSTDPMTSTELLHSAKETDPPPAYTPPVQHSSASPPPYSSIVRTHNAVVDC